MTIAMRRVLVFGGREYNERKRLWRVLDGLRSEHGDFMVVQGGADGADSIGKEWARSRELPYLTVPAQWRAHGKKAGPMRNSLMLTLARPSLAVQCPGGRGTADMRRKCDAAGVRVIEVVT